MEDSAKQLAITALKTSDFFPGVDTEFLNRFLAYCEWREVREHDEIIIEGEASESAFLIVSGLFEILKRQKGVNRLVAQTGPGTFLGEVGLICHQPRYASCRAIKNSAVVELTLKNFQLMEANDPDIYQLLLTRICRMLADRLFKATDVISSLKEKNAIALEFLDYANRIINTAIIT